MSWLSGRALLLASILLAFEIGQASSRLGVLEGFGSRLGEASFALVLGIVVALNELEQNVGLIPVRQIPLR